jgi:hypothetical protein
VLYKYQFHLNLSNLYILSNLRSDDFRADDDRPIAPPLAAHARAGYQPGVVYLVSYSRPIASLVSAGG